MRGYPSQVKGAGVVVRLSPDLRSRSVEDCLKGSAQAYEGSNPSPRTFNNLSRNFIPVKNKSRFEAIYF